jgi:hypothetical protein
MYPNLLRALRRDHLNPRSAQDPLEFYTGVRELLVSPDEALNCLLENANYRFGYSARDVFQVIFDPIEVTQLHELAFSVSYTALKVVVCAVVRQQVGASSTPPNRILAVDVVDASPITWAVNFKSEWVEKSIVQKLAAEEENEILKQISFFHHIPQAKQIFLRAACPSLRRKDLYWWLLATYPCPNI